MLCSHSSSWQPAAEMQVASVSLQAASSKLLQIDCFTLLSPETFETFSSFSDPWDQLCRLGSFAWRPFAGPCSCMQPCTNSSKEILSGVWAKQTKVTTPGGFSIETEVASRISKVLSRSNFLPKRIQTRNSWMKKKQRSFDSEAERAKKTTLNLHFPPPPSCSPLPSVSTVLRGEVPCAVTYYLPDALEVHAFFSILLFPPLSPKNRKQPENWLVVWSLSKILVI